jgi:myo-inositol catabolism protein IolC
MSPSSWMPSSETPMFILAMDHRASFMRDVFGITQTPTSEDVSRMRTAKSLIYEGLRRVTPLGSGRLGVLVDERFGSAVAESARHDGVLLAMPIEVSGAPTFELEYGDAFAEHIATFDPDFVKVLVRQNPADPQAARDTQIGKLRAVSDWLASQGRRWLFELVVPPTPEQLGSAGSQDAYDRDVRPGLTAEVITELQAGDVHPSVWKLEGYDTAAGTEVVLAAVAADIDHPARCIVLGRDAPLNRVEHWLRLAAASPDFAGFAVGRTIWENPLRDHLAGHLSADELTETVARTYGALIDTYISAETPFFASNHDDRSR